MAKHIETINDVAKLVYKILKSDRDVIMGVAGFTGEGKSTFAAKMQKEYAKVSNTKWNFERMTWSRKELLKWVDGEKNKEGEIVGRLPEYSAILPDELFSMFYRRRWFDDAQIEGIATFNMCRDRHLFICGNVPDFWDLDPGFLKRVRFYVFIPERGKAWLFQQENNPFSTDPWNVRDNRKTFRKNKNPFSLNNFICEIHYDDWSDNEREKYYDIRNKKRLSAIKENRPERSENYSKVKIQRDNLIKYCFMLNPDLKQKQVAEVCNMTQEAISMVVNGII